MTMRAYAIRYSGAGIILAILLTCAVQASESPWNLGFAAEATVRTSLLPWGTSGVTAETGLGFGDVAWVVVGEWPALPEFDTVLGTSLGVSRDWLRLAASVDFDVTFGLLTTGLTAFGSPPSWIVCAADPILELGGSFLAGVGTGDEHTVRLQPTVSATTSRFGDAIVASSLGLTVEPASADQAVRDSWIEFSIDLWTVRLVAQTSFDGLLGDFVAQSLSIELYTVDLTITAILEPAEDDGVTLSIGASASFGDPSILAVRGTTGTGSNCSGGVCYGP